MKRKSSYDNKTEDKYFKELFSEYYSEVFEAMGIDIDLECIYPEEFRQLEEVTLIPDFMGKTKEGITVLIEFQSTMPTTKRLRKMVLYIVNELATNGNIVDPYIICTATEKNRIIEVPITPIDTIHITMLTLKELDGDEILNKIKKKVKNNEKLNRKDEVFLSAIPFTNLKMSIDNAMITAAELTNKSTTIDENRRNIIKKLQSTISKKVVTEKNQEKVRSAIKMYNDYFKEELEEAKKIGKEIGEKIGEERGKEIGEKIGKEIGERRGRETERFEMVEKMKQNGIDKATIEKIIN